MEDLKAKYPWFDIAYNWMVALLIIALFVSFGIWGVQISTERKAEALTAAARQAWEEQLNDDALRETQEAIIDNEAQAVAKAFYGIDKFVEKYHYSESDLITYARCMFNRADSTDLPKVIAQTGQFTGYADNNPVLAEYYELALRLVREWHEETVKPCDTAYQFAELTPEGIFLRKEFKADAYQRRWHA